MGKPSGAALGGALAVAVALTLGPGAPAPAAAAPVGAFSAAPAAARRAVALGGGRAPRITATRLLSSHAQSHTRFQ